MSKPTLVDVVRGILVDGEWWAPYTVQEVVNEVTGQFISESSVGARIRDLRKPRYGSHTIEKKKVVGKNYYLYRMVA